MEFWQSAINSQIPLYLFNYKLNYYTDKILCLYFKDIRLKHLKLLLPNYPKNIEEMQIIRFCLEQLFLCSFEKAEFYRIMINPQIIKLLFENNKNILSVYQTFLCPSTYKNQFKFISDHLIITEFIKIDFSFMDSEEVQNNLLLKLLLNSGKRIVCVYIEYIEDISIFYNLIINNIKMSTNCSEIVPYIIFGKSGYLKMKIKADKIEIKGNEKISFCEYTNIYNPKIKCLAKFSYCRVREPDEEIISLIEIRLIRN
ncbi:F-box domain-containing protein [Meloidogyne graminicola]|uniref:F-box domain-containing protein n=1 Tax=Meloidogyne graminicola TaxID=189291 RepID=A0A8S9ZXK4_9BILA|nr:F-box domain-containing protein [Meloidogyne graminicola]